MLKNIILEEPEINDASAENSICCDICSTWWHLPCAGIEEDEADALDTWACNSCLIDAVQMGSDSDTELDELSPGLSDLELAEHPASDVHVLTNLSDEPSTSGLNFSQPNVCSSCSDASIPVGGEHICTV